MTGSFDCPRCGQPVDAEFYSPCENCKAELRSTMKVEAVESEAIAYEPKMNVTPNAVALKED